MADANIVNSPLNPKRKKKQLFEDQPTEFSPKVNDILDDSEAKKIAPLPAEPIKEAVVIPTAPQAKEPQLNGKAPKGLVNQASTIKISKEAKKKFDAIRMATGAPSAYQLLELMMDAYYEQHLTPAQKQVVDVTSMI